MLFQIIIIIIIAIVILTMVILYAHVVIPYTIIFKHGPFLPIL